MCWGCVSQTNVSGVWREVTLTEEGERSPERAETSALYELNLGQFGERVAGVSVRYRAPESMGLALFDRGDRCECAFIIQGLIERLDEEESRDEEGLFFVAQGLTFSLYNSTRDRTEVSRPESSRDRESDAPSDETDLEEGSTLMSKPEVKVCADLLPECRHIFDLTLVEGGDALIGETWCLDAESNQHLLPKRSVRFEQVSGIPQDICEPL